MRSLVPVVMCLFLIGCASESGELCFRDASGRTLATGEIDFPKTLPEDGQPFEGAWHLRSAVRTFPTPVPAGRYAGVVRGEEFNIDLTPHLRTNNLLLNGAATNERIQGVWTQSTPTGPRAQGTFSITRPR